MKRKLREHPIIKILASDRITVACLFWLFVLTFWGTIAQVEHGLYPAQERFFSSIVFLVWNFIPFPGARLVMWVFFINLLVSATIRFEYNWKHFGLLVAHGGIFLLLISAFVTFHFAKESHVTLVEGEGTNVSTAYHEWELAVWKEKGDKADVIAYDANQLSTGEQLSFDEFPFTAVVTAYHLNCSAYGNTTVPRESILNASGIAILKKEETNLDPVRNSPGVNLTIKSPSLPKDASLMLYGGEDVATPIDFGGQKYFFQLRYKRFPLPFAIRLKNFHMEKHPGTDVASTYESTIEVQAPTMTREALISMNNPFRHLDYTFYQASYAVDQLGREQSTLATVRNVGRVLPYVATLTTFLGLLIHFVFMVRAYIRNGKV